MKIGFPSKMARRNGFSLLECIAYVALFAIVIGFAIQAFLHSWDDNKALRRNAEDIVRALHVGDQWRADLRAATGPVRLSSENGGEQCRIPSTGGDIVYVWSKNEMWRQAGNTPARVWLPNVKTSQMKSEPRQNVAAWRWELELKPTRKTVLFRPLFTFEAVAGNAQTK